MSRGPYGRWRDLDPVSPRKGWQPGQPVLLQGEFSYVYLRIKRTAKFKKTFGKVPREMVASGSSDILRQLEKP